MNKVGKASTLYICMEDSCSVRGSKDKVLQGPPHGVLGLPLLNCSFQSTSESSLHDSEHEQVFREKVTHSRRGSLMSKSRSALAYDIINSTKTTVFTPNLLAD